MGIVLINNIIKRLNIRYKPLEFIGRKSMDFYVLHWIVITIVFIIINAFEIEISKKSLLFSFIVANAILVPALILIFNKKIYYRRAMGYN
jgi:peptidoglycan/LPS O-acetylase OafA/YrhL